MVSVFPAAFVFIPLTIICTYRSDWATGLVVASIPFFHVTVLSAVGHEFIVPEIAMIGLAIRFLYEISSCYGNNDGGRILMPHPLVFGFVWIVICSLSVLWAIINPTDALVHPYGSRLNDFEVQQYYFNRANLTQMIFRVFILGSVIILMVNLSNHRLRYAIRGVVLGGLLSGLVGLVYQITVLVGFMEFIRVLYWFGGVAEPSGYGFTGPIPRMASISGEPGHTAQFLLWTFTISFILWIRRDETVFRKRNMLIITLATGALLILTTSTTAYVGLVVFATIFVLLAFVYDEAERRLLPIIAILSGAIATISLIILQVYFNIYSYMGYQLAKIKLQAGSGIIRGQYLIYSLDIVSYRPFIGMGTGSYYSTSLFGTIIVENGIIGVLLFTAFNMMTFVACLRLSQQEHPLGRDLGIAISTGGIVMFLTSMPAKSITTLTSPWYWAALAFPLAYVVIFWKHKESTR